VVICRTRLIFQEMDQRPPISFANLTLVATWWETNQTDDTPVMRVSNDNGVTFGPLLTLATNGTIGEAEE
jgi:hypothetical protein